MTDRATKEREHFFGAAKIVAGITMLSRVLGLVRDIAIVAFGANRATDTFWTAFRVPNVFRRLFGEGALSAAFVPVFTETAETNGWEHARVVLANCFGLLSLLLAAIVLVIEVILVGLLLLAPGQWDRTLLIQLVMIVFPFMITICLLALGSAALNCRGHFAYPAFAPILLNLFLISGAWVAYRTFGGGQWQGLFTLSISVVLAGAAQLAGVIWLLRRVRLAALPTIRPVAPEVKRIASMTLPMMVPLGIMQISSLFEGFYAWLMSAKTTGECLTVFGLSISKPLQAGVITCLYAAERLYNFPLGIMAVSLATAVFPLFARYAARQDIAGLRDATNRALRLSLFLGVPSGVALMLLARPAAVLIYRHGGFHASDAARAAFILQMYCLGMWAYFCRHILLRAFFAQKNIVTPLKISCAMAAVNVLLVATLVFTPLRGGAIGLAAAITATASTLLLAWALHTRLGQLGLRSIMVSLTRIFAATALMTLVMLVTAHFAAGLAESAKLSAAVVVAAGVLAGGCTFLISAALLRSPELGELWGAIRSRTSRAGGNQRRV